MNYSTGSIEHLIIRAKRATGKKMNSWQANQIKEEFTPEQLQKFLYTKKTSELLKANKVWHTVFKILDRINPDLAANKSKAQIKREKESYDRLVNDLSFQLQGFRNDYLEATANYAINKLQSDMKEAERVVARGEGLTRESKRGYNRALMVVRENAAKLSNPTIVRFESMTKAQENFTKKLQNMAKECVSRGLLIARVERVSNFGNHCHFAFKLTSGETTLHARVIWAAEESVLVTPHFRFIITDRKEK